MKSQLLLKISVAVAYAAMIAVNGLANALPIGGVTTGQASDAYPNLFTPAGVTFSIWGLIYAFLAAYTLYQFGAFQKDANPTREALLARVNRLFLVTSLANIAWIFAWHYGVIWLSVLIMLVLLVSLVRIAGIVNAGPLSFREQAFIRVPFSLYFGWITVATIANITVFLVSLRWDGFGLSDALWTVVILLVGATIGILRTWKDRNVFYGLVLVWAYGGILLKHLSETGHRGQYPNVIATIVLCLFAFVGVIGVLVIGKKKQGVV